MHMFKLFLAASASLAITACASAPAALSTLSPEAALVQRQLDAYNAHDLEAFIAT
jgi:starvation-inducible outer membrane lipoprotein